MSKPHPISPWLVAMVLLMGGMVFVPGLAGSFLFDDYPNLLLDDSWKVSSAAPAEWLRAMSQGISSPAGRPLALLTFAVNHYFAGLSPLHFKLGNLVLHLLNGMLVWLLLCRLMAHPIVANRHTPGFLRWAPLLLTSAWLMHPLQVSTVLYIVQRMEIGATTGILLALLCYAVARSRQQAGLRGWHWLLLAALGTAIGAGFKETAALAPLLALLIEVVVYRFRDVRGCVDRRLAIAFAIGAILAFIGYLRVALPFVTAPEQTLYAIRSFGPWERLLSQGPVLVLYLKQILLPFPDSMTFYYDNFPVSRGLLNPVATLISLLILAMLAVFAVLCRNRWPLTSLGIAWFFACHVLTSNVIPLELAFEHRNYLALLGILLAFAEPFAALGKRLHPDARLTLAVLPVLGLATLCAIQSATWGAPMRLAWTLENRNPDSPRASYALGRALLEQSDDDPASLQVGMARKLFRHSASLPESSPLAAQGLILLDARHGRPVDPETWDLFRSSLTRSLMGPEGLSALFAVSNCRIRGNCAFDDAQLLATFLTVLERNPESGAIHTLYANFAWNVVQDQQLAIQMQREAVRLAPGNIGYQIALAKFLLASPLGNDREEGAAMLVRFEQGEAVGSYEDELSDLRRLRDQLSGVERSDD